MRAVSRSQARWNATVMPRGRYDAADVHIVRHMLGKRTVNSWKYGAHGFPQTSQLWGRLACAAMESIVVRADIPTHFF
jgi:hypothetical protein